VTTAIEKDATAYADAAMARIDDDPTRSDIELWERHLGIDYAETRALFDERLVMKRAGVNVEPLFNENDRSDAEIAGKTFYAEYAAELRNPAPYVPHHDVVYEADLKKLDEIVVQEALSRDALRKFFYRQRRDVLLAEEAEREREVEQLRMKRERLAIPVVIEGELILAPTRHRSR
jgi:hypothetical protein